VNSTEVESAQIVLGCAAAYPSSISTPTTRTSTYSRSLWIVPTPANGSSTVSPALQ
jgi:hypothetical protein